jgi:hypothetical protein
LHRRQAPAAAFLKLSTQRRRSERIETPYQRTSGTGTAFLSSVHLITGGQCLKR